MKRVERGKDVERKQRAVNEFLGTVTDDESVDRRMKSATVKRIKSAVSSLTKTVNEDDAVDTAGPLRSVVEKYPLFETMLKRAVLGEVHRNHPVSKGLQEVSEAEAVVIGNNLAPCLKSRKVVEAGVDQWCLQNKAVGELSDEFIFMKSMLVAIGYGVVRGAPWGLKMRVTIGAVTSMLDLVTDLYVTYMFWSDGKGGYFKASLASLMASIGLQMWAVWAQNKNFGWKRVTREWFPILFGFKPAVDAYRVAKGGKQEAAQAIDPLAEMSYMKGIEMFAEAIPGVIIQLMAIATTTEGEEVSKSAWFSLAVSAITTGFASATVSLTWTPTLRAEHPLQTSTAMSLRAPRGDQ